MADLLNSFIAVKAYCEAEQYKGWDPYDGLNSKVFKAIPFVGKSAIARLIWIQLFKRNPLNLRALALIDKQYNAKAIGLFIQGYCNLYKTVVKNPNLADKIGSTSEIKETITHLSELLISMRAEGFSGAAWGYNFPWQCRREFLFPANEPTVVATTFCATALIEAYEICSDKRFLDVALSSAEFVMKDLHHTPHNGGVIISYSKMQGNDTIYNASLLGSRLLSYCYKYTGNKNYLDLAQKSVTACCSEQKADGSWTYGLKSVTGWIDSFHTGYNLDGLIAYREISGDNSVDEVIAKGFDFYINNFFNADGAPKYYSTRQYPIDIHCPGQLLVTLSRLHKYSEHRELANKVIDWTIKNMQAPQGYFYYQLKPGVSSKISYMRWSNAFMFAAMSYALLEECDN
jgi:hypothetical protein